MSEDFWREAVGVTADGYVPPSTHTAVTLNRRVAMKVWRIIGNGGQQLHPGSVKSILSTSERTNF